MKKSFFAPLIAVFLLVLPVSDASALEVKRKTLKNGLVVLHVERHNLPMVVGTLLIRAGGINEPKDGLASLTASLLTEGTKSRSSNQISDEVEFLGASLGASADYDSTTVSFSVLKKDIDKGFDLFSDILLNPAFSEDEIAREKGLVKGSLRQSEEEPSFLAGRAFRKAVFGEHPYGRLLSGSAEAIDKIERKDIEGFYSAYFVPNNAVFSIAGDLTPAELDSLIGKYLGGWKKRPVVPVKPASLPAPGRRDEKIERDLVQATIMLGHRGIRRDSPDYYAVSIMNYILGGGGFSSRLMDSIRDEKGLAYDVHSFFSPNKETGLFQVRVQTKNASANAVIEEILRQVNRIRAEGVADAELQDAKTFLTGSFPRKMDTMSKISGFLAQVEIYGLGLDYMDKYPALINSVTKADIKRVAQKYLDPDNYILVIVAKQSEAGIGK